MNFNWFSNHELLLNVVTLTPVLEYPDQKTKREQCESENCAKQVEVMAGAML